MSDTPQSGDFAAFGSQGPVGFLVGAFIGALVDNFIGALVGVFVGDNVLVALNEFVKLTVS